MEEPSAEVEVWIRICASVQKWRKERPLLAARHMLLEVTHHSTCKSGARYLNMPHSKSYRIFGSYCYVCRLGKVPIVLRRSIIFAQRPVREHKISTLGKANECLPSNPSRALVNQDESSRYVYSLGFKPISESFVMIRNVFPHFLDIPLKRDALQHTHHHISTFIIPIIALYLHFA